MVKQPVEFMFSPYRRKVLATLFLRPDEKFHVRELERLTGISAGSLHRELKAMAASGLLVREETSHQVFYRVDPTCPIYEELAAIFRKTMGLTSLLQDALSEFEAGISVAFVFGSMASGRQHSGSDLDICVLGDVAMIDVVTALSPLRDNLNREINPFVMTTKRFSELLSKGDRFVTRVLNEPKLFVVANENALAKFSKDRPA